LQHDNEDENNIIFYSIKENLKFKYDSFKHLNFKDLSNLTKQWCDNKISNFDYLLILNCLAGKQLDSPFNHPIFPWITDFQSFNTNLRDLSISKFRLNKGDTHLDMTYQAAKQLNTSPPYHITEFLSEITYFVYKSRQTDKQTLCQHVRSNWVPNEYPKSIDRLYIWTPEECIPEFYCDSNIFKSIHDDLPDLQVPNWCNGSIDEFIRTHRLLLESDLVSKKLHHWVDLVFGYKLTGDAAIESKNVCLQLVDNNNQSIMKPFGIVQLFTIQHPFRSIDKYYHCKQPPNIINRSRIKSKNNIVSK
jgi:WD repeat-containing protein 81